MGLRRRVRPPDFREKLPVGEHLPGMDDLQGEQSVFGGGEFHFLAVLASDPRGQIHLQGIAAEDGVRALLRSVTETLCLGSQPGITSWLPT
jgi:hypothetical protein